MKHLGEEETVKPDQLHGLESSEITEKWQGAVGPQLVAFMRDAEFPQ